MGPAQHVLARRARLAGATAAAVLAGVTGLGAAAPPAGAEVGCTRVIGQATNTPAQLAGWFTTTGRQPMLDVSVLELATMFIEEGAREGVRGDIAFAQSIVETGYFGFSPSVPPETHNYSGIGATGGGVKGAAFPDARTGVRAQVQHLRAYADPSLRTAADLKAPLVDPRFRFLVPNARTIPCWEQFGSGVWAADPTGYGPRVLSVQQRIAAFPDPTPLVIPPASAPAAPVAAVPLEAVPAAVEAPPPGMGEIVAKAGPTMADVVLADLDGAPALTVEASSFTTTEMALTEVAGLPTASTRAGGGAAGAMACVFTGAGLLAICSTLWWKGRRFARA